MCAEADWATVRKGMELLIALDDPVLWSVMVSETGLNRDGKVFFGDASEVARRAKVDNRMPMALYCIAYGRDTQAISLLNLDSDDKMQDIHPLSRFTQLKSLSLRHCGKIQDLGPLRHLVQLEFLDINGCKKITDLAPLSNLKKLKVLKIIGTGITDLRPISKLPLLEKLRVSGRFRPADIWPA